MPLSVEVLMNQKEFPRSLISLLPNDPVEKAASIMKKENVGLLLVMEDGKLKGVISERDIVRRWVTSETFPKSIAVSQIMTSDVETVSATDTVQDCYLRFVAKNCRHLPVVGPLGDLMGVISLRDVVKMLVNLDSHLSITASENVKAVSVRRL